jgi:hypothetical protein
VSHTMLDSMPALYTQIRNEPGLTRDAQKLSPKDNSSRPTALPSRYTDQDSSQVPAKRQADSQLNALNNGATTKMSVFWAAVPHVALLKFIDVSVASVTRLRRRQVIPK